ncbi:hypothetical protein LCGC14_1495510 [marine sediment metagenome]|uniref:Uncharacterized protein n=1 Tax=marine sediment metagenome TaxID=412755 RepID=A0A0F9J647_9ZZZZ
MVDNRRWPRVRQKEVECSVDGCKDTCVGNDLCSKHNMALYRYGNATGKPKIKKICIACGSEFENKYEITQYCSNKCYRSTPESKVKAYQAIKKNRTKYPQKNKIRDLTSKRINREKTLIRLPCEVCGNKDSEAHHFNYEHPLNINWLCKKHHGEVHKQIVVV